MTAAPPATEPGRLDAWDVSQAESRLPDHTRRGLPRGAKLVVSDQLRLLAVLTPGVVSRGGIILISGPAGSGKSTLVGALAGISRVRAVNVELPPRTHDKALWQKIAHAVCGGAADGTGQQLQDSTRRQLAARPTLLVVDEAQNIGLPALIGLRWLSGTTAYPFGLILAGVGLNTFIEREPVLATRVERRILLEVPRFADLEPRLHTFHPLLAATAATDPNLLARIDGAFAHGSWRAWANLVNAATDLHLTTLTADTAAEVIAVITGRSPW